MNRHRTTLIALVIAGVVVCGTGCAGSVTASTTCRDFLQLDEQTQMSGVESLAAKTSGDAFKGPMGIDNVIYDCQETPSKTLGALMHVS